MAAALLFPSLHGLFGKQTAQAQARWEGQWGTFSKRSLWQLKFRWQQRTWIMKQLNSCTFLLNLWTWTLWFSPLWAVNCEPDGNTVLCAWDEGWLLGRSLGSAKQPESWFFWGAIWVIFLQSFWLMRGDGGGCIWAARLVPGLMKVSDSEVPAWSYHQCCWDSVSMQSFTVSLLVLNVTQKQREETCDVRNVALVWVQKYFCQVYAFPCWALRFCFATHVAACPFSLQKHPPQGCRLEAFRDTLGSERGGN